MEVNVIACIHSISVTFKTNSPENHNKTSIDEFQIGVLGANLEPPLFFFMQMMMRTHCTKDNIHLHSLSNKSDYNQHRCRFSKIERLY